MQVWCDWQLTLCDPHLSALEVRFHDDALYKSMFTFTFTFSDSQLCQPNTLLEGLYHLQTSDHVLSAHNFLILIQMAQNSLLCADVPLRNYSLTHSLTPDPQSYTTQYVIKQPLNIDDRTLLVCQAYPTHPIHFILWQLQYYTQLSVGYLNNLSPIQ